MADYYRVNTRSDWMAVSGNALLTIINKQGSNKKITVSRVEIQNFGRQNRVSTIDTFAPGPVRIRGFRTPEIGGGEDVSFVKLDTSSPNIHPDFKFYRTCQATQNYFNYNGTTTYTASVTAGVATFTPTSPAPFWVANEHRDGERFFKVDDGANSGTYAIVVNTTASITIESTWASTVATTGTIVEVDIITADGFLKGQSATSTWLPNLNFGSLNSSGAESGRLWERAGNTNTNEIEIRPSETVAFAVDVVNSNLPMFVDSSIRIGTYTYVTSYYARLNSGENAILAIKNDSATTSCFLQNFLVCEAGDISTPYFQMVPISAINSQAFNDNGKKIVPAKYDTSSTNFTATLFEIFTNVPVVPSGVPISYIPEGATALAVPKGFNYLDTKDFVGPTYMALFPEAAAFKANNTTDASIAGQFPGTFGTQHSQWMSSVISPERQIVLREGEGFAIVSGAETATGTPAVGLSAFQSFDFSFDIKVENAVTPQISITNINTGSRLQIYNISAASEYLNQIINSSIYTASYEDGTGITTGDTVRVRLAYVGTTTAKLEYEVNAIAAATGFSILADQDNDAVYQTIGINGATVTEFTLDYPNVQVDINDTDGSTNLNRMYSWWCTERATEDGIRDIFGGILAEDAANFKVITSVVNLRLDNTTSTGVIFSGGQRLYRDDGAIPVTTSTTGGGSIVLYADKVYTVETGVSGLTPTEAAQLSQIDNLALETTAQDAVTNAKLAASLSA
jgi:hypothetical protein